MNNFKSASTGDRWLTFNVEDKQCILLLTLCNPIMFKLILADIKLSVNIEDFVSKLADKVLKYDGFNYKLFIRKEEGYYEYCTPKCGVS